MKSAIEQLFCGELFNEKPDLGKDYWKKRDITEKKENALLEFIKDNSEAVKAFQEYQNAEGASSVEEMIGYYKEGFRNGFRIALDALDGE